MSDASKPGFHLRGNYAPVPDEVTLETLEVEGALPSALDGLYLRNGPNPHTGHSNHWFLGDGMLHGIRLGQGRAHWYRNRYVQTKQLAGETLVKPDFSVDYTVAAANTHIVSHAGRLLALVESSFPTEVTPSLETKGICDFNGRLKAAFTAHPKICPETGEMHAFGYGFTPPHLTYHRINASGDLLESFPIDVAGASMMHDFALTNRHVVFMDLPIIFDMGAAARGTMPYLWSEDYGARLGVMPRGGSADQVRWIEIEPCYVFHVGNAYEDRNGAIVIEVARYRKLWDEDSGVFEPACFYRWRIDPVQGRVEEEPLDDANVEFLRIDDRVAGSKHRYMYGPGALSGEEWDFHGLMKYDLLSGARSFYDFGRNALMSEFSFAPDPAATGEDEGWLLGFVYDGISQKSRFVIFDAQTMQQGPVAQIHLPRRVPQGFHGNWVPAGESGV